MKKTSSMPENSVSDYLPDGISDGRYLRKDSEWPNLENRLGQPRILQHYYFPEVLDWIKKQDDADDFFYFEAGCGHGNDLRALKKTLNGRGRFLGVDVSRAEIMRGLDFYKQRDSENTREAAKSFAVGDFHDLHKVLAWDEKDQDFSYLYEINDSTFDLLYMEAVLQACGYGYKTYADKKESASRFLSELSRVCKKGGKFLGRITAFMPFVSRERQFNLLRAANNWRFIPELDEFIVMLRRAGFDNINRSVRPYEKVNLNSGRENIIKISFLAQK